MSEPTIKPTSKPTSPPAERPERSLSLLMSLSMSSMPSIVSMYRLQWEPAQGCYVLLYPEGMVKLNAPAGEILKRCNGLTSISALIDDLQREFGEPDLRADVCDFLGDAYGRGWIV